MRLCWSRLLAQGMVVVLVCRLSAEPSQEQGGSHGAMGGQDRVNWVLLSSISSQAGPMVHTLLRASVNT